MHIFHLVVLSKSVICKSNPAMDVPDTLATYFPCLKQQFVETLKITLQVMATCTEMTSQIKKTKTKTKRKQHNPTYHLKHWLYFCTPEVFA